MLYLLEVMARVVTNEMDSREVVQDDNAQDHRSSSKGHQAHSASEQSWRKTLVPDYRRFRIIIDAFQCRINSTHDPKARQLISIILHLKPVAASTKHPDRQATGSYTVLQIEMKAKRLAILSYTYLKNAHQGIESLVDTDRAIIAINIGQLLQSQQLQSVKKVMYH